MKKTEFKKAIESIVKEYNLKKSDFRSFDYQIATIHGTIHFNTEWNGQIKVGSIHSKLVGDVEGFKKESSQFSRISNSGKFNSYFNTANETIEYFEWFVNELLELVILN